MQLVGVICRCRSHRDLCTRGSAKKLQMLPEGWKVKYSKTHNNRPYYFNETTGITQWDPPTGQEHASANASNKVHVHHLLIKHAGSRRPSSWRQEVITCSEAEALEEIKAIRSQIYASELGVFEAFKVKAGERSDCSSAKRGGDLGYFGPGEMQSKKEGDCNVVIFIFRIV